MTYSARVADNYAGDWEIYVVTDSPSPRDWPEHDFARTSPVPTLTERTAALATLGYQVADGARWEWHELDTDDDEPARLLGMIDVVRIGAAS
ncbi:DUF6303 family protein [Streptomyces goshikiensis]|uniref:DUF6303 family protein n=1 Tax=Streptomyces goshikiensis TaxID=1942 RepID=UPI00386E01E8|nr:DUF6303 family protein [Streptomyces goshikiensis]